MEMRGKYRIASTLMTSTVYEVTAVHFLYHRSCQTNRYWYEHSALEIYFGGEKRQSQETG
jgi:hypothetical protein